MPGSPVKIPSLGKVPQDPYSVGLHSAGPCTEDRAHGKYWCRQSKEHHVSRHFVLRNKISDQGEPYSRDATKLCLEEWRAVRHAKGRHRLLGAGESPHKAAAEGMLITIKDRKAGTGRLSVPCQPYVSF